jgi:hypothetical protein
MAAPGNSPRSPERTAVMVPPQSEHFSRSRSSEPAGNRRPNQRIPPSVAVEAIHAGHVQPSPPAAPLLDLGEAGCVPCVGGGPPPNLGGMPSGVRAALWRRGLREGRSGTLTVIQRFGSALNRNSHLGAASALYRSASRCPGDSPQPHLHCGRDRFQWRPETTSPVHPNSGAHPRMDAALEFVQAGGEPAYLLAVAGRQVRAGYGRVALRRGH